MRSSAESSPNPAPGLRSTLARLRPLLAAAHAARVAGNHREGVELGNQALAMAEQVAHRTSIAAALSIIALNEMRLGNVETAVLHAHRALPLMRRTREAGDRSQLLCTLVVCYIEMGLATDALGYATQAIDAARASGDRVMLSWALNRAGLTYEALGDPEHGEPLLGEALLIARETGGAEEVFSALNNLCSNLLARVPAVTDAAARAHLLARALELGHEALAHAMASGNGHRQAICESNLATACTAVGDYAAALLHIEREHDIARQQGYRHIALTALANRAALERHRGELEASIDFYEQALAEAGGADTRGMLCDMHFGLYECHKLRGDAVGALRHLEAIRPLEREQMTQRADRQARLMLNRLEIENAQAAAQRASLDAEVQRLRAAQLEMANQQLSRDAVELGRTALEDQLTGLANRRHVDREMPLRLQRARATHVLVSVAIIDLDHFKRINDEHGHATGDDVLRLIARLFEENTREGDLLARMGGEEFLLLFDDAAPAEADDVCERVRAAIARHDWTSLAPGLGVTVSIGLCHARDPADEMRALLARADAALYDAKRAGRNRVSLAP